MKNSASPIIFWHSDPAGPNETVMLAGGNFIPGALVEFAVLPAKAKGGLEWTAVRPLQAGEISLKAALPPEWTPGVYACRVRQGEQVSGVVFVNAPDIWWKQGDEGIDRARQGGWLRILGKCLAIEEKAAVTLRTEDSKESIALELEAASTFNLKAKIPADLKPGKYHVLVSNSKGGEEAVRDAGALELLPVKPAPKAVMNIVEK